MKQDQLFLISIIKFLFLSNVIFGQGITETFAFAKEQLARGNEGVSMLAYERALFFNSSFNNAAIYEEAGDANFSVKRFQYAIKYYTMAINNTSSIVDKNELYFKTCYAHLALESYNQALISILQVEKSAVDQQERKKIYLKSLIYFLKKEYSKSITSFENYFTPHEKELVDFESIIKQMDKADKIKPNLAMWMSVVLPGSGQMLYGNWKSGINSLLLSAALVGLYLDFSSQFTPMEGYLVVVPWFQRYHRGGYQNAKQNALEKQAALRAEVYRELVQLNPAPLK